MGRELISANHGAALAATMAGRANRTGRGFCCGAYPITPSTECMEFLCEQTIEKGHVVKVEGEHSAMGVCIGASVGGARTFTTSASNGIAYMAENIVAAGLLRLPIVMAAANRTMGPPWNIWVDHGDTLMLRDTGWVQIYCTDNQEVFDSILAAFRLAEDPNLLLPVMVCQDGFVLSHTIAQIEVPEQAAVDDFLPPLDLANRITLEPRVIGGIETPHVTEVHRKEHHQAMGRFAEVYAKVQGEFHANFGRTLADPIVPHRAEEADMLIVSMGTIAQTVERFVDTAFERGEKVGSARVRVFRPLPSETLRTLFKGKKHIAVLDRDVSLGFGGILWGELRNLAEPGCVVQNYLVGLGGGDVRPEHIEAISRDLAGRETAGEPVFMEAG